LIALVPHTGWAWLVRVDRDQVEARAKIVALPVLDAELYHLARDHDGDRARFFAARRDAALASAIVAVRPHAVGAKAIVLGKQPELPALQKIVASHAMIHTAEGDLWRALFAEACTACGLAVTRAPLPAPRDARWLAAAGKRLGAPWTAELKAAATAARR
jgi:hypothetical protein